MVVALRGVRANVLEGYVALTAICAVYFVWVHTGSPRAAAAASKEMAVGGIFAFGCVLPAWDAASREARLLLAPAGVLFAVLCWLNCVAIERWEGRGALSPLAHDSTLWAARHLGCLLVSGALASAGLGLLGRSHTSYSLLALSLAAAFALLKLLEANRRYLSVEALRILADAALLTPIPWLAAGAFK
jgi:hypothetical protein